MLTFYGRVASGSGNGKSIVRRHMAVLEKLAAPDLYPGTLKLYLDRPLKLENAREWCYDGIRAYLVPAFAQEIPVYLYNFNPPLNPLRASLLATVRLRDVVGLKDGDLLEISLREHHVAGKG